ncbi:hypothetical protein ACTFIZ_005985 [Dictyostelium cf. discoideum]
MNTHQPYTMAEIDNNILFVGEGNFSFSRSFLENHNRNFHTNGNNFLKITASDLLISETVWEYFQNFNYNIVFNPITSSTCLDCGFYYCPNCKLTIENIIFLRSYGCRVIFGLDARNIHELNERYSKIYWSMPHDRSNYKTSASLPNLISDFCLSCSKIQLFGDEVHLIISQTYKYDNRTYHTEFQQGMVYNIIESPFIAGYLLEKRINFDDQKYMGYKHQQTIGIKNSEKWLSEIENSKNRMEFIFKKLSYPLYDYQFVALKLRSVVGLIFTEIEIQIINQYIKIIMDTYKSNQMNVSFYCHNNYKLESYNISINIKAIIFKIKYGHNFLMYHYGDDNDNGNVGKVCK